MLLDELLLDTSGGDGIYFMINYDSFRTWIEIPTDYIKK